MIYDRSMTLGWFSRGWKDQMRISLVRHSHVSYQLRSKLLNGGKDAPHSRRVLGILMRFTQIDITKIGDGV